MTESAVVLSEGYEPRPISDLGTFEHAGWRMKLVGIAYRGARPRDALVEATTKVVPAILPQPAVTDVRYGTGFIGIHDGRQACFCFIDWWESENELHHRTLLAPSERPAALSEVTGTAFMACAWDLAVIAHERQAWVDTVLANPQGPDLDAYIACRLRGSV